jgi:hypothetical protein
VGQGNLLSILPLLMLVAGHTAQRLVPSFNRGFHALRFRKLCKQRLLPTKPHYTTRPVRRRCYQALRNISGSLSKLTTIRRAIRFSLDGHRARYNAHNVSIRMLSFVAVSIVEFRRARLLQEARLSGISVKDIARALATIAGVKAVAEFDAGLTSVYLSKAETLLELATEFAQERRRND